MNATFTTETRHGRGSSISRSGSEHRQAASVAARVEEVFKEISEHLQGHIFKSKSGAVEEFLWYIIVE